MLESLPIVINNYLFIRPIGSGAFSTVYEVESIKYQQPFAAKVTVVDSTVVSADGDIVDAEFNALKKLDHPHIIRIFDRFFISGYFIIILEYFPGGNVQDFICSGRKFSTKAIQNLGYGILDGLALCHGKCLAHRDIKPSNIFIDAYGRGKLADFNLCSVYKNQHLSQNACGSLPYVSPEVLQGGAYDPFQADIWALGVTFYQMATNELPWTEKEIRNGNRRVLMFPDDFDSQLRHIVRTMLSPDPLQRPTAALLTSVPFFHEGSAPFRAHAHALSSSSYLFSSSLGPADFPPQIMPTNQPQQQQQQQAASRTPSCIRMSAQTIIRTGNQSGRPRRNSLLTQSAPM